MRRLVFRMWSNCFWFTSRLLLDEKSGEKINKRRQQPWKRFPPVFVSPARGNTNLISSYFFIFLSILHLSGGVVLVILRVRVSVSWIQICATEIDVKTASGCNLNTFNIIRRKKVLLIKRTVFTYLLYNRRRSGAYGDDANVNPSAYLWGVGATELKRVETSQ